MKTAATPLMTTTGRFTRNVDPHQKWSSRKPPMMGPSATPMPVTAAHTPMARGRSCAGKTLVMIERVAGITNAPPTPMTARPAISCAGEVERVLSNEPMPKMVSPVRNAPRLP
ncbi:MAG: hypothetical protein M5T61_02585 [Acidimicrobiia bacterium]|nr:hypothetical protein [Acidimicrobiia bacterium]